MPGTQTTESTTPLETPTGLRVRADLYNEDYSDEQYEDMLALYEGTMSQIVEGEIVKSKILRVTDNAVILDVGFKSEGSVPLDEFKDPQNLHMFTEVNGVMRQDGSTKTMIFSVAHIVWYCSQFLLLEPGDVIITGTPPGVALGMKPTPKFLKVGDVVRLRIDGLGEQEQKVVRFKA